MKKNKRVQAARDHDAAEGGPTSGSAFPAILIGILAAAVYSNTASHSFVFDDVEGILNNPLVVKFDSLSHVWPFLREPWRPLTQFSYALTHYFLGFEPRAFHVFNILVHAMNSVLVFGIGGMAARLWLPAERVRAFALAAGLIFAVHPIQTETVAYVWGRSSSLCGLFYFSCLLLVMLGSRESAGRKRLLWYCCAVLAGILAWKSKEEAITLPFVIAGFFVLVGSRRAAAATLLMPLVLLAGRWADIGRLYSEVGENRWLVSAGAAPALSPWVYFLTHIKCSVFYYLKRFIVPAGLNADPAVEPVTKLSDPLLIVAALVLLSLGACAILAARRNRALTFGLMALLISPLTAYAVMPLADVVAEHRVYISGLGFAILAAWVLTLRLRYTYGVLAVVALLLGVITFRRNEVWADSLTLWMDTANRSPGLARPHLNLGLAYQSEGQMDPALAEYQQALAINPKLAPAYINMSDIYFARGDANNCEAALKKAIELSPNLVAPYINLAIMALRQNRPADALGLLDKAASIDDSHIVHFNKGEALFQLGRYAEAIREYDRAIELKPDLREMKEQIDLRLQRLKEIGVIR